MCHNKTRLRRTAAVNKDKNDIRSNSGSIGKVIVVHGGKNNRKYDTALKGIISRNNNNSRYDYKNGTVCSI